MAPTGVAWWDAGQDKPLWARMHVFNLAQLWRYLGDQYTNRTPDLVIVEPFTFQQNHQHRTKIDYTPAEYVGVIKLFCDTHCVDIKLSPASSAVGRTAFFGDSKDGNQRLRQLGVWDPGLVPHGMDAMRHLMKHLVFDLGQSWRLEALKDG